MPYYIPNPAIQGFQEGSANRRADRAIFSDMMQNYANNAAAYGRQLAQEAAKAQSSLIGSGAGAGVGAGAGAAAPPPGAPEGAASNWMKAVEAYRNIFNQPYTLDLPMQRFFYQDFLAATPGKQ